MYRAEPLKLHKYKTWKEQKNRTETFKKIVRTKTKFLIHGFLLRPNKELKYKIENNKDTMKKRQFQFYGHIVRMDNSIKAKLHGSEKLKNT